MELLNNKSHPVKTLSLFDVTAIIIGIVIGSGIFKLPSMVADNTVNELYFMITWLLCGFISFMGALCYAELASTYPDAGGDYFFINRAYGKGMSFIFAWARMSVIQTGSIALLGFFLGDYLTAIWPLGVYSSGIYAIAAIIILTAINIKGIVFVKWAQNLFTVVKIAGLAAVIGIGVFGSPAPAATLTAEQATQSLPNFGLAMVFVLLAFGGWNESAYVSAEVKEPKKNILKSLMIGLAVITVIYLLINWSYLRILGHNGMAQSQNIAQDLVRAAIGQEFVPVITFCILIAVLSTMNATILSGARGNYALGRDFNIFGAIGKWDEESGTPAAALIAQAAISIALVILGMMISVDTGFETMVAYTAPVFWFFFFISGISLFILRKKDSHIERVFRVPLYPVIPAIFSLVSLYMFQNSISYMFLLPNIGKFSSIGAILGIVVLLLGIPLFYIDRMRLNN